MTTTFNAATSVVPHGHDYAGFRMTPDGPTAVGGGEFRAYLRDVDDVFDTVGLLYAADVMPPAMFGVAQTGWVPTLAITVYNRAAPGPLRLRFRVGDPRRLCRRDL